jgi:hypothetical protein
MLRARALALADGGAPSKTNLQLVSFYYGRQPLLILQNCI